MNQPLVSCIVPVYNVEEYLDECIESIVNQTYVNLEIILIDDGSTDNSSIICEEWKKKDNRIVVRHKENGGASSARNLGLDIMKGDWVVFIDSDDTIHIQYIQLLVYGVESNNVLMACCFDCNSERQLDMVEIHEYNIKSKKKFLTEKERKKFYEIGNDMIFSPWNKILHRTIFSEFRFLEKRIHEDYGLIIFLIGTLESYVKIEHSLYFYRDNKKGITSMSNGMERMDIIEVTMNSYLYFEEKGMEEYSSCILEVCLNMFPAIFWNLIKSRQLNKRVFFDKYKQVFEIAQRDINIKRKVILKHKLFLQFPIFMYIIINLKNS